VSVECCGQVNGHFYVSGLAAGNDSHVQMNWHDMYEHTQVNILIPIFCLLPGVFLYELRLGLYRIYFFSNPAGAGLCRIWNDKSGRSQSQIFKLTSILLI